MPGRALARALSNACFCRFRPNSFLRFSKIAMIASRDFPSLALTVSLRMAFRRSDVRGFFDDGLKIGFRLFSDGIAAQHHRALIDFIGSDRFVVDERHDRVTAARSRRRRLATCRLSVFFVAAGADGFFAAFDLVFSPSVTDGLRTVAVPSPVTATVPGWAETESDQSIVMRLAATPHRAIDERRTMLARESTMF